MQQDNRRKEIIDTYLKIHELRQVYKKTWTGICNSSFKKEGKVNIVMYKKFPNDIMIIINEFLNWVPAGILDNIQDIRFKYKRCINCHSMLTEWFSYGWFCSYDCCEKYYRKKIMNDCEIIWTKLFEVIHPIKFEKHKRYPSSYEKLLKKFNILPYLYFDSELHKIIPDSELKYGKIKLND